MPEAALSGIVTEWVAPCAIPDSRLNSFRDDVLWMLTQPAHNNPFRLDSVSRTPVIPINSLKERACLPSIDY